ncbi:MAG: methionyl-tRNA formyltransferase [Alphaproteobacteria bacterium]
MVKLIFMGTPEFALAPLMALVDSGYHVVAVYTQPPRPKGRGHSETKSPVHEFAQTQGIPVFTPSSLKSAEELDQIKSLDADLAIVAAYGLLLPQAILDASKLGCINIHASLLPRWRGAAPIHRAVEAGDLETGITIMQMDAGLDTGAMLYTKKILIVNNETSKDLHDKMLNLGAEALLECLPDILNGKLLAVAQPEDGVTYAHKLKKTESTLDFNQEASIVVRKIRALLPWPGTVCELSGETIKIIEAELFNETLPYQPGTWVAKDNFQVLISCKVGAISLKMLQRPGSKPISNIDFLNGYRGADIIFKI